MIFITGGSYQGKLYYARQRFGLRDADIQLCTEETDRLEVGRRCIAHLDQFALNRVRAGEEPAALLRAQLGSLGDAVLISADVSCGVVPIDPVQRAWREACGRMNNLLASQADEVWRLFCGLPQRLK